MKQSSLIFILALSTTTVLKSQDGNGRLLEMLVRGLAHVVTSENGSQLVPPPIPYDPRAEQGTSSHSPSDAPPHAHSQRPVEARTPPPRVIRQAAPSAQAPGPFAGWYQAPQEAPQLQYVPPHSESPHREPVPPQREAFRPFQNWSPGYREDHGSHGDHGREAQHRPDPPRQHGFSWFQQPEAAPAPGARSPQGGHQAQGYGGSRRQESHHDHGGRHGNEAPRVIAIRSQFQPFTLFQGPQRQGVISGRSVAPAPNQGSIIWLRTR